MADDAAATSTDAVADTDALTSASASHTAGPALGVEGITGSSAVAPPALPTAATVVAARFFASVTRRESVEKE